LDDVSREVIQEYLKTLLTCVEDNTEFLPSLNNDQRSQAEKSIANINHRLDEVSIDESGVKMRRVK
jgi:hypothetical protein